MVHNGDPCDVYQAQKLKKDLQFREKKLLFKADGTLKDEIINKSTPIINATLLGNTDLKEALVKEGGNLGDWNKMSYKTGGENSVDIHYYYNKVIQKTYYEIDYKSKLSGLPEVSIEELNAKNKKSLK